MSIMAHKYTNVVNAKKNGFNNLKTNKYEKTSNLLLPKMRRMHRLDRKI